MSIETFLRSYKTAGRNLDVIYDIGACRGDWSRKVSQIFPQSRFILFEANPVYRPSLEATGFQYFNAVLSNEGREFVEFYNGGNTGDSYYKENTGWYDQQPSIRLPCRTLDSLVSAHNLPKPSFIKLDTQGSELDVLDGAKVVMDHAEMVYTECPIVAYNKGAPNIQDYLEYFKSVGFVPIALLEVHMLEGIVVQVDMLFMRHTTKERIMGPTLNIRPFDR